MKNVVLKIKNLLLGSLRTLEKHQVSVYASIILTIFFVSFWTLQKVNHVKEMTQIKKENISLRVALDQSDKALDLSGKAIEDSWEVIQLQAKTIQKYETTLDRAQNALNNQARLIGDLVEYLKKIKHWPPKEPRPEIDPDKWIIFTEE